MSGKNKPVKIRSYNSSKKYGVAAKYVKELLDKGCKLLKVRPAWKSFPRLFNRAVVKVAFWIPNNQKLQKRNTNRLYVLQFLLCLCWPSCGFMVHEHLFSVRDIILKKTICSATGCVDITLQYKIMTCRWRWHHTPCTYGDEEQL